MALNNSGPLSFGGATAGQSINLELGVSATAEASINSSAFRTLAGVSSGQISVNNFYGKSNVPTVIGQAFGGGYYAGQISTAGNGVADYYLIVAPKASGQSTAKWANSNVNISGAVSPTNGPQNTTDMYVTGDSPAANYVKGLSIGGYTDWYLPARYEQEILYYNLKPTTRVNNTDYGNNPYAVPQHGNYTSGTPAQTSATIFRDSNSEAFDVDTTPNSYWASNQWPPNPTVGGWDTFFGSGVAPNNNGKQNTNFVRAIRRIPV